MLKLVRLWLIVLVYLSSYTCPGLAKPPHGFVGLNCMASDTKMDSPKVEKLLRAAGITALRWPGGSDADSYDWSHPPAGSDSTAQFDHLATALGAEVTITTNYGSGSPQMAAAWVAYCNGSLSRDIPIGMDEHGRDWHTSAYWVRLRESKPLAVDDGMNDLRVGRMRPYAFKNWEIGNECFGDWETDNHTPKHDPYVYAQFAAQAMRLMRQVDPSIRIGVVVTGIENPFYAQESVTDPTSGKPTSEWTPLMLSALSKQHTERPDFAAFHHYAQNPGQESDARLFADASQLPGITAHLRRLLNYYFPPSTGKPLPIDCTECNSITTNPGPQTTGEANAIYYPQIVGEMQKLGYEDVLWWDLHDGRNTSGFDTHSKLNRFKFGDYGILGLGDRLDEPYPVYYAIKKFATGK